MDIIEHQHPPAPEIAVDIPERRESHGYSSGATPMRDFSDEKRVIDIAIKSNVKKVQSIFRSIEIQHEGSPIEPSEAVNRKPHEHLLKARKQLSSIEQPTIDNISTILFSSGLEIQAVQSWLTINNGEIQSLALVKANLEKNATEGSAQLTEEESKNYFVKLFRKKNRQRISDQLSETNWQIQNTIAIVKDKRLQAQQIELDVAELSKRRQELALQAAEVLFESTSLDYMRLKEKLTTPEVIGELNENLISIRILPELERFKTQGKISDQDAEEYIILLKEQLAEGTNTNWEDSAEKKEKTIARRNRLDELDRRSGYTLKNIGFHVSGDDPQGADKYYDRIFDLLLRDVAKQQVEQLQASLISELGPELHDKIAKIATETIYPETYKYTSIGQQRTNLDLTKLPIDDFGKLSGLERWPIVKNFTESSGAVSKETFARVERIIIQRLFHEQLFPGRQESWEGTAAATKMGDLGNPEALPLLLRHIETYGSGHTNVSVVYAMEQLLKKSDPIALQKTLDSLPQNQRTLLGYLADKNSYLMRFGTYNSHYGTCYYLQHGDRTIKQERYTKLLEESGFPEEKLKEFYLLSGDKEELLKNLKVIADLTGKKKEEILLDYFEQLTSHVSCHAINIDFLKQLSTEVNKSPLEIYELIKDKLSDGNPHDPIQFITELKELATWVGIDKTTLIEQHFKQLIYGIGPYNLNLDFLKRLSTEVNKSPLEIYELIKDKLSSLTPNDPLLFLTQLKELATWVGVDKTMLFEQHFEQLTAKIHSNDPKSLDILNHLAREMGVSISELLVRCLKKIEYPPKNPTLKKIASPYEKDYESFPLALARIKIGLDDKYLQILSKIYQTKTLQSSNIEREFYLEGLLLLEKKENGKIILESLLNAYKGTRTDPKRIRHIFQMLSLLNGLGEFEFVTPDPEVIIGLNLEISNLKMQFSQTQDKVERKRIKNRIETLESDLLNQEGLKGIEDAMVQKVVDVVCRKLELPPEFRDKIEKNLDEFLKNGILEIIPSLASKYAGKNELGVKNLLKIITMRIIEGDFKSWRYSHEQSIAQLSGLTEQQREFWIESLEPVKIEIESSENEKSRRADELKAAQDIIRNAKEHILQSRPDFDFSKERTELLFAKVRELIEKIKVSSSEEEKNKLALEKKILHAEATLINRIIEIENTTPNTFTRERLLTQARTLREGITDLDLPLAGLDIEQIETIFTVGDVKSIVAYESDDPITLLKVGMEPQETCQSWRNGGFNECLLSYVADSNKKVINVADGDGRIVARSVIKLTNQREIGDTQLSTQRKTLLVERPYSILPNTEVYRAFVRVLLLKAQGLDASITFGSGFDGSTIKIFEEEAGDFGFEMKQSRLDIFIPQSLNKYEYSDTLGGKISSFDRYQPLDSVTLERLKI